MTHAATRLTPAFAAAPPRRDVLAAALALVWAALVHWPSLNQWGGDDPFYLEVGRLWLAGAPPYLNAFDVKPPGFFALVAATEALFGAAPVALSRLATVCDAGTAFCLWRLGSQLGAPRVGAFAAVSFPLLSLTLADNAGYPPLALATSLAFAAFCGGGPLVRRAALAGLAIGAAGMIKQTAVFEAVALAWAFAREPVETRAKLWALAAFALAAAFPTLAFAGYFAAKGALPLMLDDAVIRALQRPAMQNEDLADVLAHLRRVVTPVAPLVAFAVWGAARAPRERQVLGAWFLAALLELIVQHARWMGYLGPALAPMLLLTGFVVISRPALRAMAGIMVVGLGLIAVIPALNAGRERADALKGAAAAIRARDPTPQDRLLGLGDGALLNANLGLAPPTPYFYWMHLLCDFPGAGPDRLREALEARPRFVVAPEARAPVFCESAQAQAILEQALVSYRRLGEATPLVVYERVDKQ